MFERIGQWAAFEAMGLDRSTSLGSAFEFFVADMLKIAFLLVIISFIMAVIAGRFPPGGIRNFLASRRWYGADYLMASVFGAITPFCSCSSIPIFIGFARAGIPMGIAFAFLITSPLINEVAVAALMGSFGVKVTGLYVSAGILLGMGGGWTIGRLRLERYWARDFFEISDTAQAGMSTARAWPKLLKQSAVDSLMLLGRLSPYLAIGVGLGAFIHGFVPEAFLEKYLGPENPWAVPAAVAVGVPLYANAIGVVPIAQALVAKGVALGTALAFMMATVGLSLPESILLKKIMRWPLLLIFFGTVSVCICAIGYLFNLLLG